MEEKKDVLILAIESSCDETAAAVVKNGREVLSNVISSQIALHTLYGGVVPELSLIHIYPAINSLWTFVVLAVAPFNLIKGVLVSVITVLLYKHISPILKGNL